MSQHGWIFPEVVKPKVVVRLAGQRPQVMVCAERRKGGDLLAHNGKAYYYVPAGSWRPFFEKPAVAQ